jgi:hypothetical protein
MGRKLTSRVKLSIISRTAHIKRCTYIGNSSRGSAIRLHRSGSSGHRGQTSRRCRRSSRGKTGAFRRGTTHRHVRSRHVPRQRHVIRRGFEVECRGDRRLLGRDGGRGHRLSSCVDRGRGRRESAANHAFRTTHRGEAGHRHDSRHNTRHSTGYRTGDAWRERGRHGRSRHEEVLQRRGQGGRHGQTFLPVQNNGETRNHEGDGVARSDK